MPIQVPALDDRGFDDLVEEILARIPAHTPDWNPRLGDPGRTLIELFAWLTETILYRANLIPERQRLAFLRLLGIPMHPAIPARGLVGLAFDYENVTQAVSISPQAVLTGPVNFETLSEVTILPIVAEAYYKRGLTTKEKEKLVKVVNDLRTLYRLSGEPRPYVTTPVFPGGAADPDGFEVMKAVDRCLWLAILAPKPESVEAVRQALGSSASGGQQVLNIGVSPAIYLPADRMIEDPNLPTGVPHIWEITGLDVKGKVLYHKLDRIADSTKELTCQGVMRLALPAIEHIGKPSNDVRTDYAAGVGDLPPRLDDPKKDARLVTWIRLRPTAELHSLSLSWVGINAVEIDQRQTITNRVIGQSNDNADQELGLPGQSVDPETIEIQVEESGRGYQPWLRVDDLTLAGRDDNVYSLDSEAGTIRFGNGVRGRIPEAGSRVRVATMRAGGGQAGNLPAGTLTKVTARDLTGAIVSKLKVLQPISTFGGRDAETLVEAEQRIPALFRHRDRAVTAEDYRRLAADTPGVRLGRVEVLPLFHPYRKENVQGVVSVMVLPYAAEFTPPNPRPDRFMKEAVCAYLDKRRLLGTEMYVIGCEYVPVGLSVGVTIADGFAHEAVLHAVSESLHRLLWPLPPGGSQNEGWSLGKTVTDRELEVIVARVPGVIGVDRINLFEKKNNQWRIIPRPSGHDDAEVKIPLKSWQLPELLTAVVAAGSTPADLSGAPNPFAQAAAVAVPVVPEVCY